MVSTYLKSKKLLLILLVAVLTLGVAQITTAADKFPSRPIELVLPVSAGGGYDLTSRVMISVAKDYFGVPMTVTPPRRDPRTRRGPRPSRRRP